MIFAYFGNRFSEAKSTKDLSKNGIPKTLPKCKALLIENRAQDTSETLPRRPHDSPRRILAPFWGPTWSQVGLFFDPRRPLRLPGRLQKAFLGMSWGRLGASSRPSANKSVSWGRLGLILGDFGVDFGMKFQYFS